MLKSISNGHPPSCVFVHSQMLSLPWLTLPPAFLRPQRRSSTPASLSRNLHAVAPSLVHTLSQEENSILSVATGDNHIYSGSQNQNISVRRLFPCPPRALTRYRSGTVALILFGPNLEVTRAACLPSSTRRINTGCLARLETAPSAFVSASASPARFPLTHPNRSGAQRS